MPTSTSKIKNKSKWVYIFPESFSSWGYLQPPFFPPDHHSSCNPDSCFTTAFNSRCQNLLGCFLPHSPAPVEKEQFCLGKKKTKTTLLLMWTKYINSHCRHSLKALRACPCFPTEWVCQYRPANYLPPELNDALISSFTENYWGEWEEGRIAKTVSTVYWWQSGAWLKPSISLRLPKRHIFLDLMWAMEEKPDSMYMTNVCVHMLTILGSVFTYTYMYCLPCS